MPDERGWRGGVMVGGGGVHFWCHCRQGKARCKHPRHAANPLKSRFLWAHGAKASNDTLFSFGSRSNLHPAKSMGKQPGGGRGRRVSPNVEPQGSTGVIPWLPINKFNSRGEEGGEGQYPCRLLPPCRSPSVAAPHCDGRERLTPANITCDTDPCSRVGPRSTFPSCRGCFAEGRVLDRAMRQLPGARHAHHSRQPVHVGGRRHGRDRRLFQRLRVWRPTPLHQPPCVSPSSRNLSPLAPGRMGRRRTRGAFAFSPSRILGLGAEVT
jgi:hypothetical protein